jgi:hypothetical protein
MTWRVRLSRWLVRHEADWMLVPTEHYIDYTRIIVEEARLRTFLEAHPQLQPTFEILKPSKQKRERLH